LVFDDEDRVQHCSEDMAVRRSAADPTFFVGRGVATLQQPREDP